MAKLRLNRAFKGYSNRIDDIVYYEWNGRTYSRIYVKNRDPKTPLQLDRRGIFRKAVKAWKDLTEDRKEPWKRKGKKEKIHGYNVFISEFIKNRWDLAPTEEWSANADADENETAGRTGAPDPFCILGVTDPLRYCFVGDSMPLRFYTPVARMVHA